METTLQESFTNYFHGKLNGIMNEDQYNKLGENLPDLQWFALEYESGEIIEMNASEVQAKLSELHEKVKARNLLSGNYPHTYARNREEPTFIKTYDPMNCGSSCSLTTPDPWWVFSTLEILPEEIEALKAPKTKKKGWFGK